MTGARRRGAPNALADPTPARRRWAYGRRGYALAQSLGQLRARPLASALTLLALGVTLALPALVLFCAGALDELGGRALEGESVTAYLDPGTADADGAALAESLRDRRDVRDTRHVTRAEALATFRENSDVGDALDALGANPLPGAVIVYPGVGSSATGGGGADDPGDGLVDEARTRRLARELEALPGVERVQVDLLWVQRLRAALELARRVAILLGGFLVLTALLVITNTIRLELARRRRELDVSRLLGASGLFLYRPVFYTGILYGLLGGLLACAFALLALQLLRGPAGELAALYGSAFRLPLPPPASIGLVVLVSTGLGVLGALLTLYGPSRQVIVPGP